MNKGKRFKIIENTEKAKDAEDNLYGVFDLTINKEELDALLAGKCLSTDINSEEYRLFLELEK